MSAPATPDISGGSADFDPPLVAPLIIPFLEVVEVDLKGSFAVYVSVVDIPIICACQVTDP